MHISILAGSQTDLFNNLLKNRDGFDIYSNDNISEGLKEIDYTIDTELILVTDAAFILNGKQLDIMEVLEALKLLANKDKQRTVLLITKNDELKTAFEGVLLECSNARATLVKKLNSRVLLDCIFNRYESQDTKIENLINTEVEPVKVELTSVESPSEPEPEPQPKPEPKPEPKPKKKPVEKTVEEKPVKPEKPKATFGKSINLSKTIPKNKIILVTGNPCSGITSTCCNMAELLASSGVKTLIIDADVYTKGINLYYDILDTDLANRGQKVGLIEAVEDLESLETSTVAVKKNLYLLGTFFNCSYAKTESTVYDDILMSDLVQYAVLDYDIVLVHIPLHKLVNMTNLIKTANNIVYCTRCTINGICSINAYLNPENYQQSRKRDIQILAKKSSYVLCDYEAGSINYDNFQDTIAVVTETEGLCRPIIGYVPHIPKFDDCKDTKNLIHDKKILKTLQETIQNIFLV